MACNKRPQRYSIRYLIHYLIIPRYRFIMTSWHGDAFCITWEIRGDPPTSVHLSPSQRASDVEIWCFWLSCDTLLNMQPNCRWFETPKRSCDATVINVDEVMTSLSRTVFSGNDGGHKATSGTTWSLVRFHWAAEFTNARKIHTPKLKKLPSPFYARIFKWY